MGKKKTALQIKKELEVAKLAAVQAALNKANRQEKANRTEPKKRKDAFFLGRFLGIPAHSNNVIRSRDAFRARNYDLGKQALAYVDHLFRRFPTPFFLYRAVLSRQGVELVFGPQEADPEFWRDCGHRTYARWFIIVAQGGSLAKEMKGQLTKKEVHCFLQAPDENSITRNLFWAKCAAAGVPPKLCQFLTTRMANPKLLEALGDRLPDVIRFYATEHKAMGETELRWITDFVIRSIANPEFSFKGRTYGSMYKLTREWHRTVHASRPRKALEWEKRFRDWDLTLKIGRVRAIELYTTRLLEEEGDRQRHCVAGYDDICARGLAQIVSMRWFAEVGGVKQEVSRITMEVSPGNRTVVQIRGRYNRKATHQEMQHIRAWAGDLGLGISAEA